MRKFKVTFDTELGEKEFAYNKFDNAAAHFDLCIVTPAKLWYKDGRGGNWVLIEAKGDKRCS